MAEKYQRHSEFRANFVLDLKIHFNFTLKRVSLKGCSLIKKNTCQNKIVLDVRYEGVCQP